jgi:nitrogen fixation/metabolism regulation signal transduction histidine kinase
MASRRRPLTYETRAFLRSLAAGAPAVGVALCLLWGTPHLLGMQLTFTLIVVAAWIGFSLAVREGVTISIHTLSNLVAALREGDYSIRARGVHTRSALGLAFLEINQLADKLRQQRLDVREATALLGQVMESIEVAVFAFDDTGRLALVNPHGASLLAEPAERLIGRSAEALGIGPALEGETPRLIELKLGGRGGRWEVRRGGYRADGRPHQLVVLSDLTRALHEEERQAWMRLVRVLSHEINNSLAPIKSIAGSLRSQMERVESAGTRLDPGIGEGLAVIENRSDSLGRFMQSYARLARLPRPVRRPVEVSGWVRRVVALETRLAVQVPGGVPATVQADPDQLDQLLINLVQNAVDATLETGGGVAVSWKVTDRALELSVEDEGPGIADTANLFVPFFTTKPGGTGIGLTLSRQIAEAHGGRLTLENRRNTRGCVARLVLPLG